MKKPMPKPTPRAVTKKVPAAKQQELLDQLAGQIQVLATRLEALRAQGADKTAEFKQVEALMTTVQDKLMLAQAKLEA